MDGARKLDGVIIDPGHGGIDSGARGSNLLEKEYNLLISRYIYDRLKELGVPVYITRDVDMTLEPTDRVRKIMSFFGNDANVVLISNHLNAGGANGKNVGKASSVLFTIGKKNFDLIMKFFFYTINLKKVDLFIKKVYNVISEWKNINKKIK